MKRLFVYALATLSLGFIALSCGEEADPFALGLSVAMPQQLQCANLPADLRAQVWQSGTEEPTELVVDPENFTTSGSVAIRSGTRRNVVIDWYIIREDVRIVLAQVRASMDLTNPASDTIEFNFDADDISIDRCIDVSRDLPREGLPVSVNNVEVPMCDLDNSCEGTPDISCSNLGEVCAGSDPLRL